MLWVLCSLTHLVMYGVKASECTVPHVEDICVYGNDKPFIAEGAPFKFFTYDPITKTNVYICEECWILTVSSAYLYGCIQYDVYDNMHYYWKISSDYLSCTAWSSCYVGDDESLGPNYSFDINDCLGTVTNNWETYDGSIDVWNDDDMSLSTCNAICHECDVYPQINTTISKSIETKVAVSTAWNGDMYFDFNIYEQDCIDPRLSFDYQLFFQVIDHMHDETYENIKIYHNTDMIIATCNPDVLIVQDCDTFSSCISDYYIDDDIEMDQTYSFSIHQTADVDAVCYDYVMGIPIHYDYIFNAVLTLTCGPNNTDNIIASTCTCGSNCNNSHNIITSTVSSTVSSTSSSTVVITAPPNVIIVIIVLGVIIVIIGIAIYCYCKCCNCIHRVLNETVKEVNEGKYTAVQKEGKRVVGLVLVEMIRNDS